MHGHASVTWWSVFDTLLPAVPPHNSSACYTEGIEGTLELMRQGFGMQPCEAASQGANVPCQPSSYTLDMNLNQPAQCFC